MCRDAPKMRLSQNTRLKPNRDCELLRKVASLFYLLYSINIDMKVLRKEEVEKIANSFDFDKKLIFVNAINFEPDCKIYKLKNDISDNFILICRDYQFDDTDAEERIFDNELGITILDRFKYNYDYFFRSKNFDDFEYIFSLVQIAPLRDARSFQKKLS